MDPLEIEKLEAMAEFAAGAGHEMNNPLAVIAGRAQLLLRGETDPDRRRDLALINGQAMRVHEMIADMMLFARPPAPQIAACDLNLIVQETIAALLEKAAPRGIHLLRVGDSIDMPCRADPAQLQVAIRAVIDNAIEAVADEGIIEVTAGGHLAAQPCYRIVVRDNGPGISAEVRRHMFDPYFSGRPAGRGHGFGLSKCWRILHQHGGTIDVASELNCGATFTIFLPQDCQQPSAVSQAMA